MTERLEQKMPRRRLRWLAIATLLTAALVAASCGGSPNPQQRAVKPKLTGIDISGDGTGDVNVGLTRQFDATGAFGDGSTALITSEVTWATSDNEVASISAGGLVTGLNDGVTAITASANGITSRPVELEVTGPPMVDIWPGYVAIQGPETGARLPSMLLGATLQLKASCTRPDGTVYLASPVTWTSSNAKVAVVSSAGTLAALSPGTVSISATYSGFKSRPTSLTVMAFSSITITPPSSGSLSIGSTAQLVATVGYPDGRTEEITDKADWMISDRQVADFTSPGVMTAKSPGSVTVRALWKGMSSDPITLSVTK